jgi:GT2 family glycosyltransferase
MTAWPSVGVVIPTHNRPQQVRDAIAGVRAQDYPGTVTTVIVHDRSEPDQSLADGTAVRVAVNSRTPGWPAPATPGCWRSAPT